MTSLSHLKQRQSIFLHLDFKKKANNPPNNALMLANIVSRKDSWVSNHEGSLQAILTHCIGQSTILINISSNILPGHSSSL